MIVMKIYNSEKEYDLNHQVCPKCGNGRNNMFKTCVWFIFYKGEPYKNENECECMECGWKGIVDDLIEK